MYVCVCVCVYVFQTTQERLSELRRYTDSLEADLRRLGSENEARVESMTSQLVTSQQELEQARDRMRQAAEEHRKAEDKWKSDHDRLQVNLDSLYTRTEKNSVA